MAAAITEHRNQSNGRNESGHSVSGDVNRNAQHENTSFTPSAQNDTSSNRTPTEGLVRKGSVTASRERTIADYRNERRGQGMFAPNGVPSLNPEDLINAMCPQENWPSHARINRTIPESDGGQRKKDGRGVLKGLKVSKKRHASGDTKLEIEFSNTLGGPIGENYRLFIDDVVVKMKRKAPLIGVKKWSDIHPTTHQSIATDVLERWDLVDTRESRDKILKIAQERYRGWRSTLHSTYKAYNTDVARMANKPTDVSLEEWEWLIQYFGTDAQFKNISMKNSDNHKKVKVKHRSGSKSFAEVSYEKRDPVTGQEPDDITLWELTHKINGAWSNNNSQAVHENACAQVAQREEETGEPLTVQERNTIFQNAYRATIGCQSTQPRGFGYMAKPPSGAARLRAELEEQSQATNETRRSNIQLNLQVHELHDQLTSERDQRVKDLE